MSSPTDEVFDALKAGDTLLEYRIEGVLGQGGFGITYLAHDTLLNARFAIKEFLPPELAARAKGQSVTVRSAATREAFEWAKQKFMSEAQVLARFAHPSLVRVSRFFEANGTVYFVMDFVAGQTLDDQLKDEPIRTPETLRELLLPLSEGVAQVHAAGVLHRDIKPANIILRADGSPVLIDFGAARHAFGSVTKSMLNVVTAGYAPIEQYSDGMEQGPWTDIYALGAVAYRVIAGHKPTDAVNRLRRDPLVPAAQLGADRFPESMLQAIDWALRVHPEERPQSLDDWRASLLGERDVPAPSAREAFAVEAAGDAQDGPTRISGPAQVSAASAEIEAEPLMPSWLRPILIGAGLFALAAAAWILRPLDSAEGPAIKPDVQPAAEAEPEPAKPAGLKDRLEEGERLLARGEVEALASAVVAWLERDPADPVGLLLRGHLAFVEKRRADGLADYALALESRPELASSPPLAANLVSALGWVTAPAEALILKYENDGIHEQLAQRAVQPGPVGRGHALRLLEELEQGDRVDALAHARLELTDREECEARIAAIETIARLGDASWIPLLEDQIPGWFSNLCLRGPIRRAVDQLRKRPPDPSQSAPQAVQS